MCFQKRDAVFELDLEGVTPREVTRIAQPAELRCPEWRLKSIQRDARLTILSRSLRPTRLKALGACTMNADCFLGRFAPAM